MDDEEDTLREIDVGRTALIVVRDMVTDRAWTSVREAETPMHLAEIIREELGAPTVADYELAVDEDGDLLAKHGQVRLVAHLFMTNGLPADLPEMAQAALRAATGQVPS